MSQQDDLVERGRRLLLNNNRQAPVVMARGEGCALFDVEGRRYLDMTAGVAVSMLGHGHAGPGGRHRRAGPPPDSRLQPLLHRGAAGVRRGARAPGLPRPGVPLQLGDRGQRGGAEAGAPLSGGRPRSSPSASSWWRSSRAFTAGPSARSASRGRPSTAKASARWSARCASCRSATWPPRARQSPTRPAR